MFSVVIYGMFRKVPVYEVFTTEAKKDLLRRVRIIPYLVAMLVAIAIFRASGAMNILISAISCSGSKCSWFPSRNYANGNHALSFGWWFSRAYGRHDENGPDSFLGNLASIIMGSSETTLYVLAVYFGSVAIRKSRHAVVVGLLADVVAVVASVVVCRIMFPG